MASRWCLVCCSRHEEGRRACPGDLPATGPERHGWRVNIETGTGIEACGVLVAPCHDLWRARILTYPNVLWTVPGGWGTLKFVGRSARDAERQAIAFIKEHVHQRGHTIRTGLAPAVTASVEEEARPGVLPLPKGPPAQRKIRFLPVRYGISQLTEVAGTGNLSESGLFIITSAPEKEGTWLNLVLEADKQHIDLRGLVRWENRGHREGRSPGMGVQLDAPPPRYVNYVRALA